MLSSMDNGKKKGCVGGMIAQKAVASNLSEL